MRRRAWPRVRQAPWPPGRGKPRLSPTSVSSNHQIKIVQANQVYFVGIGFQGIAERLVDAPRVAREHQHTAQIQRAGAGGPMHIDEAKVLLVEPPRHLPPPGHAVPERQRLRDMHPPNNVRLREVGDRASDAQNAGVTARGQAQLFHGLL